MTMNLSVVESQHVVDVRASTLRCEGSCGVIVNVSICNRLEAMRWAQNVAVSRWHASETESVSLLKREVEDRIQACTIECRTVYESWCLMLGLG